MKPIQRVQGNLKLLKTKLLLKLLIWIQMIRKAFKKKSSNNGKLNKFLDKYNIPREYLSINRKSISKGALVGLFWAFIPMPMQMAAVMLSTPFIRFNVPLAISTVWLSNPFTMPPMYYMEYLTGNFILGREGIDDIELTMEVRCSNNDAVKLYEKLGFSIIQRLKAYYRDGEDAYVMAIDFTS